MNTRQFVTIGTALAVSFAGASDLSAQYRERGRRSGPENALGIALTMIDPVGEFANHVDFGGGLELYGLIRLERNNPISIRIDGSFLIYGHERFSEPFSDNIGRVWVDVTTDNMIFSLGAGPQLNVDLGSVRMYGFGTGGFSYFATRSSIGDDGYEFASTNNLDDFTLALTAGGGMLIRLSPRRKRPVFLDLGVSYMNNGRTLYLREGGITDLRGGRVMLAPISSQTDAIQYRVGVAIGFS